MHTRKAQTGAYRSRAVICGNYAAPTEQDVFAGGADSTQVRAASKTAALMDWKVMGTDIRNAMRRDETKLVAMTILTVFRALGHLALQKRMVCGWWKWPCMALQRALLTGEFTGIAHYLNYNGIGSTMRAWSSLDTLRKMLMITFGNFWRWIKISRCHGVG